jgi:arylsulfatase A-like enzyme
MHLLEPRRWAEGVARGTHEAEKRKIYDRALAQSDAILRAVVGAFAHRPQDRAPIFVVTADHGEALGDHGAGPHATDLYNGNLHVPLVLAGPGIRRQRVSEAVSLTDLTPTVVELAGFAPPAGPGIDGRSVADLVEGRRPGEPTGGIAFAAMIGDRAGAGGATALARGGWKLIDSGAGLELYDLHTDHGERTNVIERNPAIAEQLARLLRERQALGRRSPFD